MTITYVKCCWVNWVDKMLLLSYRKNYMNEITAAEVLTHQLLHICR